MNLISPLQRNWRNQFIAINMLNMKAMASFVLLNLHQSMFCSYNKISEKDYFTKKNTQLRLLEVWGTVLALTLMWILMEETLWEEEIVSPNKKLENIVGSVSGFYNSLVIRTHSERPVFPSEQHPKPEDLPLEPKVSLYPTWSHWEPNSEHMNLWGQIAFKPQFHFCLVFTKF